MTTKWITPSVTLQTSQRKIFALDIAERAIITVVFVHFAVKALGNYLETPSIISSLLLVSETMPFVFIVLRSPSTTLSDRPWDWIFGIAGSTAPLLISVAAVNPLIAESFCLALIGFGMFLQISAKVVLGLGFGIIAANRGVKSLGPYRIVRHPMYAGYTLTHIGLLFAMPSFFNAALYALALGLQISRIYREERVLRLDPMCREFASHVPYRLVPYVF